MRNRIPPPVITVFLVVLLWVLGRALPSLNYNVTGANWLAAIIILLGLAMLLWAGALFKEDKTTVNPFRPKNTKAIVARGPFRFTRNPMYLGMMLVIIGMGIYVGSLALIPICAAFWLYMNETQIKPEERALIETFGEEYQSYMTQVRRWI